MPDSSADDSPHRPAPQVAPTVMSGDNHRPHNSGASPRPTDLGNSPRNGFASPSNLNLSKQRPRSGSFDSFVWNGGYKSGVTSPGMLGQTSKSFYGNKNNIRDFGTPLSSPTHKPFKPSGLLINQNKGGHRGLAMVNASANKVQASTLRTERSNKWSAGSGKVEKGQYTSWKDDQENRGEDWDTKMKEIYTPREKNKNEVKFGQISSAKLGGGGDSRSGSVETNIDLTVSNSPAIVLSPHMIGFQNHGNTCYLNASLQALLGLPMLVTDAVNTKYAVDRSGCVAGREGDKAAKRDTRLVKSGEDSQQQVKLVIPFLEITRARECGEVEKVTRKIDLIKTELEQVDKQFIGNKMQDANEFLCRLMDSMKENIDQLFQELSPGLKAGESLVTEKDDGTNFKVNIPNLVNSNFLSEREETFTCRKCEKSESNRHSDLNFYCTVARSPKPSAQGGDERPVPLQKLVDNTFETDEVRERHCEEDNCGYNEAFTTNRLVRLPRVLVLHLKRYDYEQGERSRKISRPVSLPAKLNLTKYVADSVVLPDSQVVERLCAREPARPPTPHPSNSRKRSRAESEDEENLSSPFKVQGVDRLDSNQCVTPVKFRGKTAEEIEAMGDNDKLEYTMHISMKSVPATTNNNIEDQNLAAAIQASLNDTPAKRNLEMDYKIFSDSPTTATASKFDSMDVSGDDTVKMEAPKTQEDEDRQIQEALRLSVQEEEEDTRKECDNSTASYMTVQDNSNFSGTEPSSPREIGESSNNNQVPPDNNNDVDDVVGLPEHDYRLVSVVSHYGATTSSGHYVADVYRFDKGSWFRYDDRVVTPINEVNVRKNSNNTKNGYIFMYVQEVLAQKCDTNKSS